MSEIESRGYVHPEVLVSTDWVAEHLNDPAIRIVESNEDPLLYASGHIPGAVEVDWTRDLNDPVRRDYLGREGFEALMRRIGVDQGHDGRLLRRPQQLVGDLCLLGLPALRPRQGEDHGRRADQVGERGPAADQGRRRAIRRATTRPPSGTTRRSAPSATRCWSTSKAKKPMVDVRSPDEYSGERSHMPEYPNEGALRGGHIPGAASVPWAKAVNPDDGTFKTADELRALYENDAKIKPGDDVIVYCRIGERSSHTWFVLTHLLGFKQGPQL